MGYERRFSPRMNDFCDQYIFVRNVFYIDVGSH